MATANYYEDLVIKSGRDKPALAVWTQTDVSKWVKKLVEYGRIGVAHKKRKFSRKTSEKGFTVMMVGFAMNHGPGCYRVYNPKTNRIIFTRDISWSDFKPRQLESEFNIFEPGIDSESNKKGVHSGENTPFSDGSSISSHGTNDDDNESDESSTSSSEPLLKVPKFMHRNHRRTKHEHSSTDNDSTSDDSTINQQFNSSQQNKGNHSSSNSSSSSGSNSSSRSKSESSSSASSDTQSQTLQSQITSKTKSSRRSKLSKPLARRSSRKKTGSIKVSN